MDLINNLTLGFGVAFTAQNLIYAFVGCLLPLLLGFVLPAMLLFRMALVEGDAQFGERFLVLSRNSFLLAGITGGIGVLLALLMAYAARLSKTSLATGLSRLVGLGYAVPGAVIAVGVLIPVTRLDNWLAGQWEQWFGSNPGIAADRRHRRAGLRLPGAFSCRGAPYRRVEPGQDHPEHG